MSLIDVDSELMNLTRSASNCPSKKYVPDGSQCGKVDKQEKLLHGKDCYFTVEDTSCLLYTSPSPRDAHESRMPSSA